MTLKRAAAVAVAGSIPSTPYPQQYASPPVSNAHLWEGLIPMLCTGLPRETATGDFTATEIDPMPSWPKELEPQHIRTDSVEMPQPSENDAGPIALHSESGPFITVIGV